ncbi:MAG: hypothetical protein IPJ57_20375 [Gemmatimonadetes bacterium]|nr:hypothetical protein [Gemmatimonadota bacterium]
MSKSTRPQPCPKPTLAERKAAALERSKAKESATKAAEARTIAARAPEVASLADRLKAAAATAVGSRKAALEERLVRLEAAKAKEPSGKLTLHKDGIDGEEIAFASVPNGNDAFQYAKGRTEEGGAVAVYRRRADERGSYGGWRWEADIGKLIAQDAVTGAVKQSEATADDQNTIKKTGFVDRGSVGASLTKEQRKAVLKTLVDVYKAKNAPKEFKGFDQDGNERYGYAHSPDLFEKSDITGAMVRYHVTLPDSRIAHPTEIFPDYTQSEIDAALSSQKYEEQRKKGDHSRRVAKFERIKSEDIAEANRNFWKESPGGGKAEDTILYTDGKFLARGWKELKEQDLAALGDAWRVKFVDGKYSVDETKPTDEASKPTVEGGKQNGEGGKSDAEGGKLAGVYGYSSQPESFQWAAKEVGGAVVYSRGDIALVEGFSPFGNAVYAGVKGDSRTRADISAYTGKMFSETEKAELEKAKADHVKEQGRLHEKAPDGPFSNGARFAKADGVSDELAGVAQKWLSMLGIKSRVFLATKADVSSVAAIDKYNLRGPFSAIRSAGTQNEADGGKRTLPNGDHYIILPKSARKSHALEALAHEIGHILESDEWKGADRATKDAVMADYQRWLDTAGNTKAADWVKQLRAHTSGKLTRVATSETADRLPPYWRSFGEYFADQVSRWATTSDKPLTAVDTFFKRIALAMRRLYAMAAGKPYLPGPAMKAYLDARGESSPLPISSEPTAEGSKYAENTAWIGANVSFIDTTFNGEQKKRSGVVLKASNGTASVSTSTGIYQAKVSGLSRTSGNAVPIKGHVASDDAPGRVKALDFARDEFLHGSPHWYVAATLRDDVLGNNSKLGSEAYAYLYKADNAQIWDVINSVAKSLGSKASSNADVRTAVSEIVAERNDNAKPTAEAAPAKAPEAKGGEAETATMPAQDGVGNQSGQATITPSDSAIYDMAREGKSAQEILEFIGASARRPFDRYLAKALMNLGVKSTIKLDMFSGWKISQALPGKRYAAAYSPKTDTVAIFTPRGATQSVLHELVHAATLKALANPRSRAAIEMRRLFKHVQDNGQADGMYGMRNVDEFVAEAFSNPKFQQALMSIPAPSGSSLKSAWEWFVGVVARMLGMRRPAQATALDRAMVLGAAVMNENAAMSGNATGGNLNREADDGNVSGNVGGDISDTITIDGVERPRMNSNGKPIAQTDEALRKFYAWFGDSAVTDEKGRPLVMYHGTHGFDIKSFAPQGQESEKALSNWREAKSNNKPFGYMNFRSGTFFSPNQKYAESYASEQSGIMYPVYIKAEFPVRFDQINGRAIRGETQKTPDALFMVDGNSINEVAILDPAQVKSATGNTGEFSPDNPDIRFNIASDWIDAAIGKPGERKIVDHSGKDYTKQQLEMFRRTGRDVEKKTVRTWVAEARKDIGKKLAQGLVDQFAPIKELSTKAYGLLRLSKGATGAFEVFMRGGLLKLDDGAYSFDNTKRGGVIDNLLTPLQNESGDFMWWVAANRAGQLKQESRLSHARGEKMRSDAGAVVSRAAQLEADAQQVLQQAGNFSKQLIGNQYAQKQNARDANSLIAEANGLRAQAAEMRAKASELMAVNRERLFSDEDVAAGKTLADGDTQFDYTLKNNLPGHNAGEVTRSRKLVFADSLKTFNEFNKNALDMAEQSGLIDPESRKVWEREFYIPFYRVSDEDGIRGVNVKSGVVRQEAFKHLKGGTDKLNSDLLENTLNNWAHLIDAAAKNRAADATMKAARESGVASPSLKAGLEIQDGKVFSTKSGEMVGDGELKPEHTTAGKKTVWYMNNGQREHYTVSDPYVLTAISALEYAGLRGGVMDAMSFFKHVLTVGVTASPFFKIRNLIRDSLQAIGTANLDYNPAKNIKEGFKATKRGTDEYYDMLAGGGLIRFGTMLEGSEANRRRALVEQGVDPSTILDNESAVTKFYHRKIEPMIEAYNELGNRGEEITRAALYKQLRAQGVSHVEASLEARDLMDFSMQGSFTAIRFLTQIVPFLNARMQGLYKLGRSHKTNPKRLYAVVGATALFSLSLLAAYGDDDDWNKREDWDRDNYWWFKIGGVAFRIPKPFEVGAIGTLAERSAELMFDNEMTGQRFRSVVLSILSNQLAMNPVPQMVKPAIDIYANKDSFTGRPIETMGMEHLATDYRFRQSTSMVSRGLSTAGNALTGDNFLSPVQIDHLVRGYFAWLGAFVVGGADSIVRSVVSEPDKPTRDPWKFATGSLVSSLDGAQSRYVSQMYEQYKVLEQAYGTYRHLLREGKTEQAKEYAESNAEKLARHRKVAAVKRTETLINRRIRDIERSDLSADEKREKINAIRDTQDRTARILSTGTTQ